MSRPGATDFKGGMKQSNRELEEECTLCPTHDSGTGSFTQCVPPWLIMPSGIRPPLPVGSVPAGA
eukprot:2430060-Rhodomonas_salina.7